MAIPKPVTVDFETHGIERKPDYPPRPVGISIKKPGKAPKYYGFGHPCDNNCTEAEAKAALLEVWDHKDGILCHNGKFDYEVALQKWGMKPLPWHKIHDTLYLLFLADPHARSLELKPAAVTWLGEPPDEQEAVRDWLLQHQPLREQGIRMTEGKQGDHYWAKYICLAPGGLVGRYANGDTHRTERIFQHVYPQIIEAGMGPAYDTERELMPILLEAERDGVPVNRKVLQADVESYNKAYAKTEAWLRKELRAPELNIDSGDQLAAALLETGKADRTLMGMTAGGKISTAKDSIAEGVTDKRLAAVLSYRARLKTALGTFMEPWLEVAQKSNGLIYTSWHSTRNSDGGGVGTRTGRLSSTPNFQNIPKEFKPIFYHEDKALPKAPFELPALPLLRRYIEADKGYILIGRDFASQELRMLAHFENGRMAKAYTDNPDLDLHQYAAETITRATGIPISRTAAKTLAFALLYGLGLGGLAERLGVSVEMAKTAKAAYLNTFPDVKEWIKQIASDGRAGKPIVTFGGRIYYCEEPKIVKGRPMDFSYKLVNYEIQGSSADYTKRNIINFTKAAKCSKLLLNVHDELLGRVPKEHAKSEMAIMKECLNHSVKLRVPMRSDGEVGSNWGMMKACA